MRRPRGAAGRFGGLARAAAGATVIAIVVFAAAIAHLIWQRAGSPPLLAWLSVLGTLAFLTAGGIYAFRTRMREPRPEGADATTRVLAGWVVSVAIVSVAVFGVLATLGLLLLVKNGGADEKIEAVRTGLTVAAGVGGGWALLLAVRRQQLGERTQRHTEGVAERTQAHNEVLAADARYDGEQRRPGSLGESHPEAPTDPCVNLSIYTALLIQPGGIRSSTPNGRTVSGRV